MKRFALIIAAAALPLSGCSGGKKADAGADKAKAASTDEPHVNPWAKDGGASPVPSASASAKPEAKPTEEAHVNPWAKSPPPGSVPSPAPSEKPKPKKTPPPPAMD